MTNRADAPPCAYAFDSMLCCAPAGHEGPHITSNDRFPHGRPRADAPRLAEIDARLDTLDAHLHDTIPTEEAVAHHYEIGREALATARALLAALRAERDAPEGPWKAKPWHSDPAPKHSAMAGWWKVYRGGMHTGNPQPSAALESEAEALAVRDALNAVNARQANGD